jgi:hypothetical protein
MGAEESFVPLLIAAISFSCPHSFTLFNQNQRDSAIFRSHTSTRHKQLIRLRRISLLALRAGRRMVLRRSDAVQLDSTGIYDFV